MEEKQLFLIIDGDRRGWNEEGHMVPTVHTVSVKGRQDSLRTPYFRFNEYDEYQGVLSPLFDYWYYCSNQVKKLEIRKL
jgi:hypothetical protein